MNRVLKGAVATMLGASAATLHAEPAPRVVIEQGQLAGTVSDGITSFKGIPYAAPPVGELRWRAPQAPQRWAGIRNADAFGAKCTQPNFDEQSNTVPQSEDCLTLNVWKPANTPKGAKLAVMVWIHGGGSFAGSSRDPIYDGAALARNGVIVVSINYRLGALGYFVHPSLTAANADAGLLANYGLMDQRAALQWVQKNIGSFGGDHAQVTIFGESAGGCYVNIWMTSPAGRGLFSRAISQSCPGFVESRTMAEADERGVQLATSLGVRGSDEAALEQLRNLPPEQFVTPAAIKGMYPYLDGVIVQEDPFKALDRGRVAKLPWLIGSNSFEAIYLPYYGVDISKPLAEYSEENQARIQAVYVADGERAGTNFLTDKLMGASDRLFAQAASAAGGQAWLYSFRYEASDASPTLMGVPHGGELPFVFGNPGFAAGLATAADRAVSEKTQRLWTDFAKGLLPTEQSWTQARQTLVIDRDGTIAPITDYHRERLDLVMPFARSAAGRWDP
jgi:para-nitrobenzyl esterase